MSWFILGALLVLCMVCPMLIYAARYEDGILGRVALAGITVSSLTMVLTEVTTSTTYHLNPETKVLIVSVALFIVRHAFRFWRFHNNANKKVRRHRHVDA